MTNQKKLLNIINNSKIPQVKLAEYMGISVSYMSQLKSRKQTIRDENYQKYFNNFINNYTFDLIKEKIKLYLDDQCMKSDSTLNSFDIDFNILVYGEDTEYSIELKNIYKTPFNSYTKDGDIIPPMVKESGHAYEIGHYIVNSIYDNTTDQEQEIETLTNKLNTDGLKL